MERKLLLAFDVDGTLECGDPKGPIKLKTLKKLKESDIIIGIIGARDRVQKSLKELDFYYPGDPQKHWSLQQVKVEFKPVLAVYVADRETDRECALKAGFSFMYPEDFCAE